MGGRRWENSVDSESKTSVEIEGFLVVSAQYLGLHPAISAIHTEQESSCGPAKMPAVRRSLGPDEAWRRCA